MKRRLETETFVPNIDVEKGMELYLTLVSPVSFVERSDHFPFDSY